MQIESIPTIVEEDQRMEDCDATPQQGCQNSLKSKHREFALLSYISALERELEKTRFLVKDWRDNHEIEDNQLRTVIVDPTINLEIKELRQRLFEKDILLKKSKEDLNAQNFNPQSVVGQRLVKKCKTLLDENDELGKTISESRLQPLSIFISNLKKYIHALKVEMTQLRELNFDMDADNDALTSQLSEMTRKYTEMRTERDGLLKQLVNFRAEYEEGRQMEEHIVPSQNIPETKESRSSVPSGGGGSVSSKEIRRGRSDKNRYGIKIDEKDRDSRRFRDRYHERERTHEKRGRDSGHEKERVTRRRDKTRNEKEREKDYPKDE
ncbi:hypothetical protein IE077_000593 [Cardiosporidium cionae]|uniref:Pre-mRNA-splicing regulator WTAP n=1 Tax=Cardiosporidium cionae TaxID=476202 RepID=A0ABQ7J7N1_9APIC|nr:hypothetical protein IE077_000593 [Cardiosporidium cionae]|eukprot:KAF8819976.1 hypothetical protein IE077_000593 [Cardiosporidium cionae]